MTPIEILVAGVNWEEVPQPEAPNPSGLPYATHKGVFQVDGFKFRVYRLSNARTVVHAEDVQTFLLLIQDGAPKA